MGRWVNDVPREWNKRDAHWTGYSPSICFSPPHNKPNNFFSKCLPLLSSNPPTARTPFSSGRAHLLAQPLSLPGGSVTLRLVQSWPGWTPRLLPVPPAEASLKLAVLNAVLPSTTTALVRTLRSGTTRSIPIGATVRTSRLVSW